MTEEDKQLIIEGNIKIAKFMGWRIDNSFPDKGRVWILGGNLEMDTTFKFHSSWDILMPVIHEIIDKHQYCDSLHYWFDMHAIHGLETAWQAVIWDIDKLNTIT